MLFIKSVNNNITHFDTDLYKCLYIMKQYNKLYETTYLFKYEWMLDEFLQFRNTTNMWIDI